MSRDWANMYTCQNTTQPLNKPNLEDHLKQNIQFYVNRIKYIKYKENNYNKTN